MIVRPFTLISGMMFALSGAYLFTVKHHSEALDDQLTQVTQATRQDEQSIRVLQAQWALEADPSRLASLAAQFTGLQPMKPGQLTTLASLGSNLPAPGSLPPGANPADPVPAMPQLAQAAPASAPASASPAATVAPAQAPVAVASAAPAAKPAASVRLASFNAASVAVSAPGPAVRHAQEQRVASAEGVAHHAAHRPAHVLHEENASALYVADAAPAPMPRAEPLGAQVMSVRAVASAEPASMPMDNGGSLLGMAQGGTN